MEKLEGGFINQVFRDRGVVVKQFAGEELVGISTSERRFREAKALLLYKGTVAPKMLGFEEGSLLQEFVDGVVLERSAENGSEISFVDLGKLLKTIHKEVPGNLFRYKSEFEEKFKAVYEKVSPLLGHLGMEVRVEIDWRDVFDFGITRVHRDFWMGNVINSERGLVAIDFEFFGIGSPYEDFAIVDLWIFREHGSKYPEMVDQFWGGYGRSPNTANIEAFLKVRCLEFLATTDISDFLEEEENGFYHNKIKLLMELK